MVGNNLVPELSVSNLEKSLKFYCDILGFTIEFERAEDRFDYLSFHGSEVMLEEDSGRPSPWTILPFDYSRGRGLNLSINCPDVDALVATLHAAGVALQKAAENCWYRDNDLLRGQRNFLVLDPDGYLLRFAQQFDTKPVEELGRGV
jgi:catechol 2,3-dioxygenase-like lactoylglutathione lyase family enzyme